MRRTLADQEYSAGGGSGRLAEFDLQKCLNLNGLNYKEDNENDDDVVIVVDNDDDVDDRNSLRNVGHHNDDDKNGDDGHEDDDVMMMMMTETPHRNAGGEFVQLQDRGRPQQAAMGNSPGPCSVNSKISSTP